MNFGWLQTAIGFLVIFTTLVFFHELGHFLFAKLFKMQVEEFAIGMGPRLIKLYNDGQTDYTIRAFPFGGFVKIAGMEIEDSVESRLTGSRSSDVHGQLLTRETNRALDELEATSGAKSEFTTTNTSTLEQEAADVANVNPNGFNSRPIYQRFFVILAGPVFSFLLGWLALCSIGITTGLPTKVLLAIGQVQPGSVAEQVGLKQGDIIESLNGKPSAGANEALTTIRTSAGKVLTLTVRAEGDHSGATRTITATPRAEKDAMTGETVGRLGFGVAEHAADLKRTNLAESFRFGTERTAFWFQMMRTMVSTGAIKDSVGGPISIIRETQGATKRGGADPLFLLGQLSLSLFLFNLLPIPILDGGHLALMGVEAVRRKKLTANQTAWVLNAGFVFIALLTVTVLFKDIRSFFVH